MAYLLIILIIFFYLQSCQLIYPAEGDIVISDIAIGNVKLLVINDVFDVFLSPEPKNQLTIECGENQAKSIKIYYDSVSQMLILDNTVNVRGIQGYRRINVKLHTNVITEIMISQSAGVYFTDTLHVPRFTFTNNGDMGDCNLMLNTQKTEIKINNCAGKYIFSGTTDKLYIFNQGLSIIDATNLFARDVECNQLSAGNCYLNAKEKLKWKIYRNGNIFQKGEAEELIGESYGKGKLYVIQ